MSTTDNFVFEQYFRLYDDQPLRQVAINIKMLCESNIDSLAGEVNDFFILRSKVALSGTVY